MRDVKLTDKSSKEDIRMKLQYDRIKQIEAQIKKIPDKELNVGDLVRIKLSRLYPEIQKLIKSGNKKNIIVSYRPRIYQITRIAQKASNVKRAKY